MGRVEAICISKSKGEKKTQFDEAEFIAEYGINNDVHAGDWHRQVSILPAEEITAMNKRANADIAFGDFAENLVISGLDCASLGLGTTIKLGDNAILKITQIGKDCYTPCEIQRITGECIVPTVGLFARVETGGIVRTGDTVQIVSTIPRIRFQGVVLTISDRCSRGEAEDTAGPAVEKLLNETLDINIYKREIIPDEMKQIAGRLKHYCDGHSIDIVVTVGGTGFSPRDVTPEATCAVVDRSTPGLDEAMRAASLQKTENAILSRSASGIRKNTVIVN
ncbi:MAG: MOSC domain-containing protein, partial [bacterium]|nr:MOSC domain-containing protein [bacterium]